MTCQRAWILFYGGLAVGSVAIMSQLPPEAPWWVRVVVGAAGAIGAFGQSQLQSWSNSAPPPPPHG